MTVARRYRDGFMMLGLLVLAGFLAVLAGTCSRR